MRKLEVTCKICNNELELTPDSRFCYCDKCNIAVDRNNPEIVSSELFGNFNEMHSDCIGLRKELKEKYDINVSEEGRAYEVIGWPGTGENKLYQRHCSAEFGTVFDKGQRKYNTEEYKAILNYIEHIKLTKKYGQLLIQYAELMDMYKEKNLPCDGKLFDNIINTLRSLYKLADIEDKEIKVRKVKSLRYRPTAKTVSIKKEEK